MTRRKLWKHPELTGNQATLIGKTLEQVSDETELGTTINGLKEELAELKHYKTCDRCRIELCLSVERYLGSRGPWYISLQEGDLTGSPPNPRKYNIGKGKAFKNTLKFIDARLSWAQQIFESELRKHMTQLDKVKVKRVF